MRRTLTTNAPDPHDPGSGTAGSVRGTIGAGLLCLVTVLCLTSLPSEATELANPMEKHFSAAEEEPKIQGGRSGKFADHTLPSPAKPKTATPTGPAAKATERNNIRQVSDIGASASVWDKAVASLDNKTTLADWGATSSPSASPTNAGTSGFGATVPPSQTNPYFNTGTGFAASPTPPNPWTAYGQAATNASGMAGNTAANTGYGYYNQGASQSYATPWTANPYAAYGGGYGNGMDQGVYGAYSGMNGMYASPYDPYGMQAMQHSMQNPGQQQLALYQAMLQQEMIRREVEQEIEEEERADKEAKAEAEAKAAADASWSVKQLMPVHVTSPLGSTLLACAKTITPFNTPKGPDRGVGQPLQGASWLDRPWYFGGFCGWISGSELVSNMIDQKDGGMGGLILGYNISEYWGLESRLHFASIDIRETANGRKEFYDRYTALYPDSTYVPSLTTRTNQLSVFDVSVHYYPLGNAKWRPYFKYGLGVARESFVDTFGTKRREDTMTMPIGVGLRYWWNKNLAIQADLIDNVVFSSGIAKTQNNVAFCVGLTYSYGSSKRSRPTTYWPYTPSHGSKR